MARIAVVDDNEPLRRMVEATLTRAGHTVEIFPDGAAALLALAEAPCDLVISDVQMPRLDGISLCKALRERFHKGVLPLILVSVLDGEQDIVRGLEAGANDYLVKPFSTAALRGKVSYQLGRAATRGAPPPDGPIDLRLTALVLPHRFGAYELLEELGSGSYGAVYRAVRAGCEGEPQVAVKLLAPGINRDRALLGRYFREVGMLQEVHDPHVVSFVEAGFEQGHFYLAMELAEGVNAWDLVKTHGPLPVTQALRIGADVADALGTIHRRGLVHRDVKTSNVVVAATGDAKLIDFGLAKLPHDASLTSPEEFLGTAEYVAPEVIAGSPEHAGSDIYSLGVTIYEMLAARYPFTETIPLELLARVATFEPAVEVKAWRAEVPDEVSLYVAGLMQPEPNARPDDGREIAAELRALADAFAGE